MLTGRAWFVVGVGVGVWVAPLWEMLACVLAGEGARGFGE